VLVRHTAIECGKRHQHQERVMKRFLIVASAIALTLATTSANAGNTRDHRGDGSPYSSPQGGVRVYSGHRPHPGYGVQDPKVQPAPSADLQGATVRDHRSGTVHDHRGR
jgi:hypothetical protein